MATAFRRAAVTYTLAVAVLSTFQYLLGNGKIYWLFSANEPAGMGPFLNRDHFASFILLVLPMAIVEMLRNPRQRWFFGLAAAVFYASVVASTSRAGFVLVTLELVLLISLLRFSARTALAVGVLAIALGFVVGWGTLYDRLQAQDPYAGRREVAEASLTMFRVNWWHGFGLGTWTQAYPAYAQKDFGVFVNAAHNDWLQWACDGGVLMAGCLLCLFCCACAKVKLVPWALGIPLVLLHGLIDFPMQGRFFPASVILVLGVATRAAMRRKGTAQPCR
jgi:O-antigen ligase